MAELLNIFPKVYAQEANSDAISQPTFGTINISQGGSQSSTILLKSTSTATKVGERFKVRVEVKTNNIPVSEYKVVIDFDPTKLQVVDQDSTVTGNQIKNLDTIFLPTNPQTDNIVSATGRITFKGQTTDGNALSINREVLEIEFQTQAVGSSPIKIATGSTGSQLIRQNGSGISYTGNEVTLQISPATTGNGTTTPTVPANPITPTSQGSTGSGNKSLPDTAFEGGVSDFLIVGLSVMVIITGLAMSISRRKRDESL